MQVLPIILELLNAFDTLYKGVIGVLWNATITFGLNPKFAFLIPFTSYSSFRSLGVYVSGTLFFQFSAIVLLISSTLTLAYNSLVEPRPYGRFISRLVASIILGSISFFLTIWVLKGLDSIYSDVYSMSGINWSNFLLFSTSLSSGAQIGSTSSYSALIELFTLTGYFTAVVALFAELILRQALMLMALILIPLGTTLFALDHGRRFALVLWEIIVEMSAYPFLVLLCLYLAHVFSWDMPLQLAFLFLPSLIPGIFFATGNSFLSAPIMGFVGGMSLSRTVGKGIEAGGIVSGLAGETGIGQTIKNAALFPVTERNPLAKNFQAHGKRDEMPWKEILREELKFRQGE